MVEVGSFTSRGHAEMAAEMLEAHGVGAHVLGDDAGGAVPHVAVGTHGYRIAVADADADAARELLEGDDTPGDEAADARVSGLLDKGTMRVVAAVLVAVVVLGILMGELL